MSYPAAHSMDTTWFAVDDAGEVAVLDTGEAGALPIAWDRGQDGYDGLQHLSLLARPLDPAFLHATLDPTRRVGPSGALPATHGYRSFANEVRQLVLVVNHPRVRDRLLGARWLPTTRGRWLSVSGPVPSEVLADLCRRSLIDGGWWDVEEDPRWYGLFHYQHDGVYENHTSGPYVRDVPPPHPVRADALPAELQEHAVRLPGVRFARDARVQPVEILPCTSHQAEWVDLAGRRRPFE